VPAEAWALFSACCFAGSHVVSKRGLKDTSVTAASLIVLGVSWTIIAIAVLFDPPAEVTGRVVLIFAALGLMVPAIARWAVLKSVDVLGPSIAIPIQQGLRPLLAVTSAVLLLGEDVSLFRGLGVALILAGGWQLSRRPPEGRVGRDDSATRRARRWALRRGVVFPLTAAVAYATSDLLIRSTLGDDLVEPSFAAMVSTGSGLFAWLLLVVTIRPMRSSVRFGPAAWWLVASGGLIGFAIMGVYQALSRGEVSLVTPINATQPLFVLLLSAFLLRDVERIQPITIVAASAIVAGAILVSL